MFGLSKPPIKPQAGASQPQLGLHPDSASARRAQALNQAPDSIPGMFKPGEFVLPPDTVHAMGGKQALQGVVDATHTPVAGGFGLRARPPEPAAKPEPGLGLHRAMQQSANPVDAPKLGLRPQVFFANGGAPEDELAKRAQVSPGNAFPQASSSAGANIYAGAGLSRDQFGSSGKLAQVPPGIGGNPSAPKPNSFGDAAAASNNAAVTQISVPAPAAAPVSVGTTTSTTGGTTASPATAPAAARAPGASELYMQDRAQEMGDQWKAGNYAQAVGTAGRAAVQGLGMYGLELADKTLTPAGDAVGNFAKGLFGADSPSVIPSASAATVTQPAAKPVASAATPATSPVANTLASPATTVAATTTTPAASSANQVQPGVYNHGRGQYSDNAAGMGLPAGFTGKPNAQNDAAASALAQSGVGGFGLRRPVQPEPAGFGLNAPTVSHSGNDWAARNNLRNLEVSASSITNRPEWQSGSSTSVWGSRHNKSVSDPDGKIARFNAALNADLAAQGKAPELQQRTNEVNAGLQRAAMGEAGADRRAAMAEAGAGARAANQMALGLGRLDLDQRRASSEDRLREPQIRAAERLGQMQDAYLNAKTPEEQAAIAAQMRAYSGKDSDSWKAVALQGGTDAQGNKTESMLGAVNERTGEMRRMGGEAKPAPTAHNISALRANPQLKAQFDAQFGAGAADKALAAK